MSGDLGRLMRSYTAALQAYLKEPGEVSLRPAGDLGRQALEEGLGILDALAVHEQALASLQPEKPQPAGAQPAENQSAENQSAENQSAENQSAGSSGVSSAGPFLRELLAPFDRQFRSGLRAQAELEPIKQTLLEQREQVEAASKELESFRYSVSHDLRAPLRAIDGFGAILEEEYAQALSEDGRHCLEIVRSSTHRLGQLIEDLLLLVRVGRAELRRQNVAISDMAGEVAAELQGKQPERKVAFHLQAGLTADADPKLLRIVLESLLGNAFKFTAKTAEPRVDFGAIEQPEGPRFFVRDNGVGFNMEYAGKLFTPFQRLHAESDFPGTGIGLAVVRRIVRRHGGEAWMEAAVDRGATVYFTLPPARSRGVEMT